MTLEEYDAMILEDLHITIKGTGVFCRGEKVGIVQDYWYDNEFVACGDGGFHHEKNTGKYVMDLQLVVDYIPTISGLIVDPKFRKIDLDE